MSVDLSKIGYGAIVGPSPGVSISKIGFGAIVGPSPGVAISKIGFGIIIDTLTPEASGRRRQFMIVN